LIVKKDSTLKIFTCKNGRIVEVNDSGWCVIEECVDVDFLEDNLGPDCTPVYEDRWSQRLFGDNRARITSFAMMGKPRIENGVSCAPIKLYADVSILLV
jgi:hypothetical protein